MTITAAEQYLLELINRARLDPVAEAARYRIDLNASLSPGQLGTESRQVLALNDDLNDAAIKHSLWMLAVDVFSHTGANGSQPWDRATAEGYAWNNIGENIAFTGTTASSINLQTAISQHHQGLFLSAGHRVNMLNDTYREVGIAQEAGDFRQGSTTYRASMLTELFGLSGSKVFVTGVAYTDSNSDGFYSIGEGRSGVTFASGAATAVTAAAGGYGLSVTANAGVTVSGTVGTTAFTAIVNASDGNVKLDVVNGDTFYASGGVTLLTGIQNLKLLGLDGLHATGTEVGNQIHGNAGNNLISALGGNDRVYGNNGVDRLFGGDGNDVLRGGSHRDFLYGGAGRDRLYGDMGNDVLSGGDGADSFYFLRRGGMDVVTDFDLAEGDRMFLETTIWGGTAMTAAEVITEYADVVGNAVVFDFGNGQTITLSSISTLDGLDQAINII